MSAPYLAAKRRIIDTQVVEGSKKCARCGRAKSLDQFAWIAKSARHHSWCKLCVRLALNESRQTEEGRERVKARNAVAKAYKSAWSAARGYTDEDRADKSEYWKSERGRIVGRRNMARIRLRKATTDEQRARIQALIDRHTAALAALDAEDE